jgi:HEAT repeat protein
MHTYLKTVSAVMLLLMSTSGSAQPASPDDAEALKITALEALMSAPPERALPIVEKVLAGNNSDEVKERALFILSQIDLPAAQTMLLDTARQSGGEMRLEAIRMVGIGGQADALVALTDLYSTGDEDVRRAVLEAYLIAGDAQSVYQIAVNVDNEDDYEEAVEILGAMGARDELQELRNTRGTSATLIEAYAISGDAETLRKLALDTSDPELQGQAIEALGIIGGAEVKQTLVEIYQTTDAPDLRAAALDGLLIANHDEGILELYRASDNPAEKKELLQYLVMMDSEAVWDLIDSTLEGER